MLCEKSLSNFVAEPNVRRFASIARVALLAWLLDLVRSGCLRSCGGPLHAVQITIASHFQSLRMNGVSCRSDIDPDMNGSFNACSCDLKHSRQQ